MKQKRTSRLKQYLFVIRELTGREIKRKYSRSRLGIVWSVLHPLLHMIVMSLVFSQMFKRSIENFPVYYLCGSVLWTLFTTSTQTAMTALVDNKQMLIKGKIPMRVFVISRVYTAFVNFIYSLIAFIPILVFFHIRLDATFLFLIVIVLSELMFCIGFSYVLSIEYVFFGDVRHLYGIMLTLWMYLSAIFYPVNSLSGIMLKVVANNPVYLFIDGMRWVVLENVLPPTRTVCKMIAWSVLAYLTGNLFFRKNMNKVMQKL